MPLSFVSTELLKSHRTNSDEGSSAKPRLSSAAPEIILSGRGNLPRTERPRDNRADMDQNQKKLPIKLEKLEKGQPPPFLVSLHFISFTRTFILQFGRLVDWSTTRLRPIFALSFSIISSIFDAGNAIFTHVTHAALLRGQAASW